MAYATVAAVRAELGMTPWSRRLRTPSPSTHEHGFDRAVPHVIASCVGPFPLD